MSTSEKTMSVELAAVRKLDALAETTTNKQEKLAPVVEAPVPAEQYANLMRSVGFPEDKITSRVAEYTQQPIPVWGDGDLAEAEAQIAAAPLEQQVANTASTSSELAPQSNQESTLPTLSLTRQPYLDELALNRDIKAGAIARQQDREKTALFSDGELQTDLGALGNAAANMGITGVTRIAQWAAPLSNVVAGTVADMASDEFVREAYNRKSLHTQASAQYDLAEQELDRQLAAGEITPEENLKGYGQISNQRNLLTPISKDDEALLAEDYTLGSGPISSLVTPDAVYSNEDILRFRDVQFEQAEKIKTALGEEFEPYLAMVNPLNKDIFIEQIADTAERAKVDFDAANKDLENTEYLAATSNAMQGVATLVGGALENIYENPAAVVEYVGENVPQLAIGMMSKAALKATSFSYAMDIYSTSIEQYKEANAGEYPKKTDALIMLGASLAAGALDAVTDLKILDLMKHVPGDNKVISAISNALSKSLAGRATKKLVNNSVTVGAANTIKATAKGALIEAPTEGIQTALESNFSKLNTDYSLTEIYTGATIGAAAGGGASGGGRAASETARLLPTVIGGTKEGIARVNNIKGQYTSRQEEQRDSAIEAAINSGDTSAFAGENASFPEPMTALLILQARASKGELSPEENEKINVEMTRIISEVDTEADAAVADFKRLAPDTPMSIEKFSKSAAYKEANARVERATAHQKSVDRMKAESKAAARPTVAAIDTLVEGSTTSEEVKSETIVLMMIDPEAFNGTQIKKVLESPLLTEAEKTFVRNFTEVHGRTNAEQTKEDVTRQIIEGRDGFKGVKQYLSDVGNAIQRMQFSKASQTIAQLRRFSEDHIAKGVAVQEAMDLATSTGEATYTYNTIDGYKVEIGTLSFKQRELLGAVEVRKGKVGSARSVVEAIKEDNAAINFALLQAESALSLAQGTPEIVTPDTTDTTGITGITGTADTSPEVESQEPTVTEEVVETTADQVDQPTESLPAASADATPAVENVEQPSPQESQVEEVIQVSETQEQTEQVIENIPDAPLTKYRREKDRPKVEVPRVKGGTATLEVAADFTLRGIKFVVARPIGKKKGWIVTEPVTGRTLGEASTVTEAVNAATQIIQDRSPEQIETVKASILAQTEATPEATEETEPVAVEETVAEEDTVTEVATEETVFEEVETGDGQFSNFETPNEIYNLKGERIGQDLIARDFTQSSDRDSGGSSAPLADTKNFFSKLFSGDGFFNTLLITQYLQSGKDLTGEQIALVTQLNNFINTVKAGITADLKAEGTRANNVQAQIDAETNDWRRRNLSKFFKDEDLENVISAVALAAWTYVAENGSSLYNDDFAIRGILGLSPSDNITPEMWTALSLVGTRENLVIQRLGKAAARSLGLKANNTAHQGAQVQLELALGALALDALVDVKMVERTPVSNIVLERPDKNGNLPEKLTPNIFISMTQMTNAEGKRAPSLRVERATKSVKNTDGLLRKLFNIEVLNSFPGAEPGQYTQDSVKNSSRSVPIKLKSILEKVSSRPNGMRADMAKVRSFFDIEHNHTMIGVVETNEALPSHKVLLESQEAKNRALIQEYDNLEEFSNNPDSENFFLTPVMWQPQRVGLKDNLFNPQTSKVQRHNMYLKAWDTVVTADNLDHFKLMIAQGLGIKVDKLDTATALAEFEEELNEDKLQTALSIVTEALNATNLDESITPDKQAWLAQYVAAKENNHTLDALVTYAGYQTADSLGQPFTSQMFFEIDGVTNGPALAQISLGTASLDLGQAFGFYPKGSPYTGFNNYKSGNPANLDMYERLAADILEKIGDSPSAITSTILYFTGDLTNVDNTISSKGRNFVKQALTSMVFGASVNAAVRTMGETFIESFYDKLQEDARLNDIKNINFSIKQINKMIPGRNKITPVDTILDAMQIEFTPAQTKAIAKSFKNSVGKNVKESMEERFEEYLETRNKLNEGANALYERYDAAYQYLYNKKLQEKIESGEVDATNPTTPGNPRIAREGLSTREIAEIEKELDALRPILETALSKIGNANGDLMIARETGIDITKLVDTIATKEGEHNQSHSAEVRLADGILNSDGSRTQSLRPRGMVKRAGSPGVRAVILLVHSLDSYIAAMSYDELNALNIHDALGVGLADIMQASTTLNRNTLEALTNFSVAGEIAAALQRSFDGEAAIVANHPELKAILDNVEMRSGDFEVSVNRETVLDLQEVAIAADIQKISYLQQTALVDQYPFEGAAYALETDDYAKLDEQAAINQQRKIENDAALVSVKARREAEEAERITKMKEGDAKTQANIDRKKREKAEITAKIEAKRKANLESKGEPVTPSQPTETTPTSTGKRQQRADGASPWGRVGMPVVASVAKLETLLSNNPTAKAVIAAILKENKLGLFEKNLLRSLSNSINLGTKFQYVTPELGQTPVNQFTDILENARAAYTLSGDSEIIYVKSSDFEASGITEEMVLHELVHAATAQILKKHETKTNEQLKALKTTEANAVLELRKLYSLASEFVNNKANLAAKFAPHVTSVDEMVAWGMTNNAFQIEVLSQISIPMSADTIAQVRESGLRGFIRNLTQLFFAGKTLEVAQNGMGTLIANTGLLFEAKLNVTSTIALQMAAPTPSTYTTNQIFSALENPKDGHTAAHTAHLRELLASIVGVIYGNDSAIRASALRAAPKDAQDVYLDSVQSGELPFSSGLMGLGMSDQESFTAESIQMAIETAIGGVGQEGVVINLATKQLMAIRKEVMLKVKAADLFPNDTKEVQDAKYDVIFGLGDVKDNTAKYLGRFAAAAMTHAPLKTALEGITLPMDDRVMSGETLFDKVQRLFYRMLKAIGRTITRSQEGESVNSAISNLTRQIATAENKRKKALTERLSDPSLIQGKTKELSDMLGAKLTSFAASDLFKNSSHAVIRAPAALVRALSTDSGRASFTKGGAYLLRGEANSQAGFMRESWNEIMNEAEARNEVNDLLAKSNTHEIERQKIISEFGKTIVNTFNKVLTDKQLTALTKVVIRGDMSALLPHFDMATINELLTDPAALNKAITDLEGQLTGVNRLYYLLASKGLADHMVTGKARVANLSLNAHNIASLYNTGVAVPSDTAAVAAILDPLISLHALRYQETAVKHAVADVLRDEAQRKDNVNAFEGLLRVQESMKAESLEALFDGSPIGVRKGYSSEIYNPYISVKAATEKESIELLKQGYELVTDQELVSELGASDSNRKLYAIRDGGNTRSITGIFGNTNESRKGFSVHDGVSDVFGNENKYNALAQKKLQARKAKSIQKMFSTPESVDPGKSSDPNYSVPVLNQVTGEATTYRYLMEEKTKDTVLQRENSLDKVMGNMKGNLYDKTYTPGINSRAISLLKAQYDADFLRNQADFVDFSNDSSDPAVRERFRLLPGKARREIRDTFGREGMWVHKDVYNINFGYRKYSVKETINSKPEDRNLPERVLMRVLESQYGVTKKASLRLIQGGQIWTDMVSMFKDIVVIKSVMTTLFNEFSNFTFLFARGVPMQDIIADKAIAFKATQEYIAERKERDGLRVKVEHGFITGSAKADAETKIVELTDGLARNPVASIMDGGMFQTLLEDIDVEADQFSYATQFSDWATSKTSKLNKHVLTASRNMLLTHDTRAYKFLKASAVYSDFTSRYVLHKHQTTRRDDPLSQEDSMRVTRAAFVNYDVPTNRSLQYLNDTGWLPFTKYYMRIQSVIADIYRRDPARAIALLALDQFLPGNHVLEGSILAGIPFNMGGGATDVLTVLDEPAPIALVREITGL